VLSGKGLCDVLITRLQESYRLWWVVLCDLETSCMSRPSFEVRHSRCVGSITKESLCTTQAV